MKSLIASCIVSGAFLAGCPSESIPKINDPASLAMEAQAAALAATDEMRAIAADLRLLEEQGGNKDAGAMADAMDLKIKDVEKINEFIANVVPLATAEDGWDLAEAAAIAIGALIPSVAVAAPIIAGLRRRNRHEQRITEDIVTAVAAGGGPAIPKKTSAAMSADASHRVREIRNRTGHLS